MVSYEFIGLVFTGLSISISIIYYANVLGNANRTQQLQLETRQAQLFMQIYSRWQDDNFVAKHDALLSYEFTGLDDFLNKYGNEGFSVVRVIGRYYEGVGVLVKRGLVDVSLVDDLMSATIIRVWERLEPLVREYREAENSPQYGEFVEYLYHQIKSIVEKQHPEPLP